MTEGTQQENSKDGLALIIGGLFILALVFAAYKYFNNPETTTETINQQERSGGVGSAEEEEAFGDLNGEGAKDEKDQNDTSKSPATGATKEDTSKLESGDSQQAMWTANDYSQGEIKSGSYTVKAGDTLWEIAEGVYGNGADWTKILEANKGSVGFLANGQQALIMTGQVLTLP